LVLSIKPLRVALLGYGLAGKTFHAPLIGAVDGLELCAVASRDAEKVRTDLPAVSVHSDPFELVASPQIDLVVIATPNETHAPLARAALEANKHVVVDKPFTLDLAEARDLLSVAERKGVLLSVFHNRRWDSDFLTVRHAIETRAIGTVVHFESHFDRFRPAVSDRWRERRGPGSGVWFDLGPHLIDQALQLFGLPDRVQASLASQREGAQTDDWAHAILFYGERRIVLHAGMLVAGGTNRFVVHGTEGTLVKRMADQQESQLLRGVRPGMPGWGDDPDCLVILDCNGAAGSVAAISGDQRRYYRGIVDAIAGAAPNPVSPIEALAVMAILEAAANSARHQISVAVPMTQQECAAWGRIQNSRQLTNRIG
jgi:predicted dehydrogenase